MATTASKSCWSQCFWCISTCKGARTQSVAPSDPFPVVSINGQKDQDLANARATIQSEPLNKKVQNGTVNQFFVPDDNGDSTESQQSCSTNNPEQVKLPIPQSSSDYLLKNSIFIEIDKDRKIRVVHLEPKSDLGEETNAAAVIVTETFYEDVVKTVQASSLAPDKKHGEEEDEYWFSKWTRKPRFRSIFEKNTIHGSTEDEECENNNSVNSGTLSKDFEMARAAAAAKRRAWAYNNGPTSEPVVQQFVDAEEEEEFSSISICDNSQKWSKNGRLNSNGSNNGCPTKTPPNTPRHNSVDSEGVTNFGYEEDDVSKEEGAEVIREMAVDCPPDFISPVKSLSLKRGASSPSPSPSSTTSSKIKVVAESKELSLASSPLSQVSPEEVQEVEEKSLKKAPVIFFLHGISGSSDVWTAQMEYFHNLGYEIVAPDLLGHGYSSTPNNGKYYHFESLAQDLLSVYDYFVEENRKAVLVGHGYGACLAAVITRVRPKSSALLISISGGGPTPLVNRSCCRSSLIPFYCNLFHTNPKKGRFDDPELRHVIPSVVHKHIINGQIWTDGDSAFYRRIIVPTLLVFGMKDKVVNLVEICEMERTIPKSFLEVIDTAGHMVMIDEPAKLNRMLGKFIQSWV